MIDARLNTMTPNAAAGSPSVSCASIVAADSKKKIKKAKTTPGWAVDSRR